MGLAEHLVRGAFTPGMWLLQAVRHCQKSEDTEMQGQDTQKTNNVVSLFAGRDKAQNADTDSSATSAEDAKSFEDVVAKNAKNKERMEKERANANKSVLRSYRIKH